MNYEEYTQEDWNSLSGVGWSSLLRKHPQFSEHCNWSKLDGYDWSRLLTYHPQFSEFCDWDKLNGCGWRYLLTDQPQFHEYCDWSKLDGFELCLLLIIQPQFSEFCDWDKLTGWDWSYLLKHQPQFSNHRKKSFSSTLIDEITSLKNKYGPSFVCEIYPGVWEDSNGFIRGTSPNIPEGDVDDGQGYLRTTGNYRKGFMGSEVEVYCTKSGKTEYFLYRTLTGSYKDCEGFRFIDELG